MPETPVVARPFLLDRLCFRIQPKPALENARDVNGGQSLLHVVRQILLPDPTEACSLLLDRSCFLIQPKPLFVVRRILLSSLAEVRWGCHVAILFGLTFLVWLAGTVN
jgi:hypothetical protein